MMLFVVPYSILELPFIPSFVRLVIYALTPMFDVASLSEVASVIEPLMACYK
jgi:hypothetical protein